MATASPSQTKAIRILYMDDQQGDLDSFTSHVHRNRDMFDLQVRATKDPLEATQIVEAGEDIDVFICDQNMPGQMGFDMIKYLMGSNREILYVLYTVGTYRDENLKLACEKEGIMYFIKTEEFTTLIEQIQLRLNGKEWTKKPIFEVYSFIADTVIDDLAEAKKIDPKFSVITEGRQYFAADIIREIKNRTPFASEYLKNYIRGLKFFNDKRAK